MARALKRFDRIVIAGIAQGDLGNEELRRLRRAAKRLERVPKTALADARRMRGADAVLVDIGVTVDARVLSAAPSLRYIGVFGTGFGPVDVRAAGRAGVVVTNVPGYATTSVAEFTLAAVLAEMRGLPRVHAGRGAVLPRGRELRGATVGVIGLGRIGREVARIANEGFGAHVVYWSRTRSPKAERAGIAYRPLPRLLATSDVVSVNLAHTSETKGLLSAARLASMKPGAVFVNFASAALVDLEGALPTLRRGRIVYLLDHADELDPRTLRALKPLPNARLYPPIGYETLEARRARARVFVANAEAFLRGRPLNVVTPRLKR